MADSTTVPNGFSEEEKRRRLALWRAERIEEAERTQAFVDARWQQFEADQARNRARGREDLPVCYDAAKPGDLEKWQKRGWVPPPPPQPQSTTDLVIENLIWAFLFVFGFVVFALYVTAWA